MSKWEGFEHRALEHAKKVEASLARMKEKEECAGIIQRGLEAMAKYNIERARTNKELLEAIQQQNEYVIAYREGNHA